MTEPRTVAWRNGAKVTTNTERLKVITQATLRVLPVADPEALSLCMAHPKKGWAKRYLRAWRMPP